MWSLIPYFIYLLFLYFLVDKLRLVPALVSVALVWVSAAVVLVFVDKNSGLEGHR
jgi:membrane protein GlpM